MARRDPAFLLTLLPASGRPVLLGRVAVVIDKTAELGDRYRVFADAVGRQRHDKPCSPRSGFIIPLREIIVAGLALAALAAHDELAGRNGDSDGDRGAHVGARVAEAAEGAAGGGAEGIGDGQLIVGQEGRQTSGNRPTRGLVMAAYLQERNTC